MPFHLLIYSKKVVLLQKKNRMTKEQYVDYWIDTSNNDWVTAEVLFDAMFTQQTAIETLRS